MNFLDYCKIRYRSKADEKKLLSMYNDKASVDIADIKPEFLYVFHYVLSNSPCHYWSAEIKKETYNQLNAQTHGKSFAITEDILESYYIAFDTYKQITEVMRDFSHLNIDVALKNRLYRLPTYTSIAEGCLTNLFRVLALILEQLNGKEYRSQNKLGQLCQIMEQTGFIKLIAHVDVEVRNAINHGGVVFLEDGKKMLFKYMKNHMPQSKSYTYYEFDKVLNDLFDSCTAILLGITEFINEHLTSANIDEASQNDYLLFKLLSMRLSLPSLECLDINDSSIGNEQLNIIMAIEQTDKTFIAQTAIEIASQAHEVYPNYKKYYIQFHHPRMLICFIRFTSEEVQKFLADHTTLNDQLLKAIKRGDFQWSEPSDEMVDIREIKYFQFPNLQTDAFSINTVENASTEDRKRIKANLFIGEKTNKAEILDCIKKAVEWVASLKNVAILSTKTKHGDMAADSVYLTVFRHDTRKDKTLLPKNENFVCFVDYNIDGKTTLASGGVPTQIWTQYFHETIDLLQIAWRERTYVSGANKQKQVGRNDVCPCGSGKKYKKCCGK